MCDELLPCPFCGKQPQYFDPTKRSKATVHCLNEECGNAFNYVDFESWQHRYNATALTKEEVDAVAEHAQQLSPQPVYTTDKHTGWSREVTEEELCEHEWEKTMDLGFIRRDLHMPRTGNEVVLDVLQQKQICKLCGKEEWKEV